MCNLLLSNRDLNNKIVQVYSSNNPSDLTYTKKRLNKQRNSSAFLSTGREAKSSAMRGSISGNTAEGVEVGRYTPRYPTKTMPSYSFSRKNRDTNLFLFAEHTWIRDVNQRYVGELFLGILFTG
jgi:hypothetical protein